MPCKFSQGTICTGKLVKLLSLPTEEAEIVLSEHGFLLSVVTLAFEICDGHLVQTKQENRRKWAHNTKCCIPPSIAAHNTIKANKFSGNRRVTRDILKRIHTSTGIIVPIGAPICTLCRKSLAAADSDTFECTEDDSKALEVVEEVDEPEIVSVNHTEQELESLTEYSSCEPESQNLSQISEASACAVGKREILNAFLLRSNLSPVKEKRLSLKESSSKTQSNCITKALQCIEAICETICPGEGKLLEEKVRSTIHSQMKDKEKVPLFDETLFILKEVYLNADTWLMQRQILSIIVKDRDYNEVKQLIQNVSHWKFTKAKTHCQDVGCGMPLTVERKHRNKMNEEQLEHFIDYLVSSDIVKDLPYGTKTMKLSTGQIVEVPNLIRSLAPSSLIEQYKQLCAAQNIKHLGVSTLYKILDDCAASIRKCIEGLDYYVAEGGRSFQELEELIHKLPIEEDKKKSLTSSLLSGKSYLKTELKVHIKAESNIADHCRKFALRETGKCNHPHNELCEQCENLESVINEISRIVHDSDWENKDAMLFQVDIASENIRNWKKHIVRSRNQEEARLDLVGNISEGQLLITSDWAMKFLPRKYREGQTDWFAKRGLNWHISVSVYKEDDVIKNITHVHIFSSQVSQDAGTTAAVIKDTVEDLSHLTDIKELHFFSDNAGCYKNTLMISTLHQEFEEKVKTYNFSESQDGKGPCDRRASHVKAAIKRYINEGHDVTSAEEMKKAIDSRQTGQFRVKVIDTITNVDPDGKPLKAIPNISQLFNFVFEKDGLRVYKAYKIGEGDVIPWNSIGKSSKAVELVVKMDCEKNAVERTCDTSEEASCSAPKKRKSDVFDCTKEGCTKSFNSNLALENHLLLGDCSYDQEAYTSHDKAKTLYSSKVNNLFMNKDVITLPSYVKEGHTHLMQGWALKSKKKRVVFSESQKNYMKDRFYAGKRTGSKIDPYKASLEMRQLKVGEEFVFTKDDYLTPQQISSYFSRLALKDRNLEIEDFKPAEEERCKEELKSNILKHLK